MAHDAISCVTEGVCVMLELPVESAPVVPLIRPCVHIPAVVVADAVVVVEVLLGKLWGPCAGMARVSADVVLMTWTMVIVMLSVSCPWSGGHQVGGQVRPEGQVSAMRPGPWHHVGGGITFINSSIPSKK